MTESSSHVNVDQPATYRIKLQGRLDESWSKWLDGMCISIERDARGASITTLTGQVADQAALFGLLSRIRDLGLPLLLVKCIE